MSVNARLIALARITNQICHQIWKREGEANAFVCLSCASRIVAGLRYGC